MRGLRIIASGKDFGIAMILTCPQCATRYQADAAKFQPSGRNVRCGKCGHVWRQDAPAPESDAVSDMPVIEEEPPPPPVVEPPAAGPDSPATLRDRITMVEPPREKSRWPVRLAMGAGWASLIAIVLLIGWAAAAFRQQIATLWPQSASLYAALGMDTNISGLDIRDVRYSRTADNGGTVIALTGELANTSARELPVPQLRAALIDDDRRELYHWTFSPALTTLRPGQRTTFQTRLTNPPAGARHVEVRFAKAGE